MKCCSIRVCGTLIVAGLVQLAPGMALAGDFEDGVRYYRDGDYQQAIRSFEHAVQAGSTRPALFFNLGVSYFKLGQYRRSQEYFLRAEKDPKFSQLAQYNLGRVALALDDRQAALKWFLRASRESGDPRITAMANAQIDAIEPGAGRKIARGGIHLAWGHDNNVLLLPDNSPSRQSDSYLETWLFGSMRIDTNVRIGGSWYRRDYADINGGDYDVVRLKLDYLLAFGGWKLEPGVAYSNSNLGTRRYLQISDFIVKAEHNPGEDRIVLRYRYSDISARDAIYNYLDGSRHQARIDFYTDTAIGRVRYRYQLELNDRQDQAAASYSPTRHDFRTRLRRSLGGPWRLELEGQYRLSDYPTLAGVTRKDKRLRLRAGLELRLDNDWILGARATYTNNNSNIAVEDYSRTDWQINARLRF